MNALWPRFLKVAYRKEPISSFVVIFGAVDAVIGGVGERWSLMTFGLAMVGIAIALRWWQTQQKEAEYSDRPATRFLPASPSRTPLPMLSTTKRQPPH
jgi:hypothetical protein